MFHRDRVHRQRRQRLAAWACVLAFALVLPSARAEAAGAAPSSAAPAPSVAACPPAAEALTSERMQAGLRNARDHGFLWRIAKGGRTSYLYGTVHIARLAWAFPGPTVMRALAASDTIALELDMLDPDIAQRLARGMVAQADAPLPDALTRRLQRQMEAACLPPQALAGISPEMQIATLTVLAARRDGLDPAYGADLALAGLGRGAAKAVVSLETPESQLQALRPRSPQEAAEFIESGLDDLERGRARPQLRHIAQVWADSDRDALAHFSAWCECERTDAERELQKRLLDERNPPLADAIDALHQSGKRAFAAVGSLHMVGPLGLPALMMQRGYVVEPVDFGR